MFTGSARAPARSLRECACVRGGDGVSRRSRGQEIDGNHGNNTRVLATLYNLQHCHSAQPVRHTQTVVYATRIVANAEVFRFISCTISERKS